MGCCYLESFCSSRSENKGKNRAPLFVQSVESISSSRQELLVRGKFEEEFSGDEREKAPKADVSSNEYRSISTRAHSYTPNHRYENCRDSDDEFKYWMDSGESDLEDEGGCSDDSGDDDDGDEIAETNSAPIPDGIKTSRPSLNPAVCRRRGYVPPVLRPVENLAQWKVLKVKGAGKESIRVNEEPEESTQEARVLLRPTVCRRRGYIPPVLRPVENLTQWKALKAKGAGKSSIRANKARVKEPSSPLKKCEVRVDASLSAWLISQ